MPHAGTHITIVQRLALQDVTAIPPAGQPAADQPREWPLGDPKADADQTPQGRRMRYACLGALGPDIFYLMMDYALGLPVQNLTEFLVKVAGTFECAGAVAEQITRYVDGSLSFISGGDFFYLQQNMLALTAIMKNAILGAIAENGFNFWALFCPPRQKDRPRHEWYWADYLHYIKTGEFAQRLFDNMQAADDPDTGYLTAYALGYLTHYVTDVVGHPYVNQIVQGPWRDYWQRHLLAENYIDSHVWARWHTSNRQSPPQGGNTPPPTTEEQPLDTIRDQPLPSGQYDAPYTYARVNDWINIGTHTSGDPVDGVVEKVCEGIAGTAKSLIDQAVTWSQSKWEPWAANWGTIPVSVDVDESNDEAVMEWAKLVAQTLRDVYTNPKKVPTNLQVQGRPDGYPTPEDVAQAYATTRLIQRFATEVAVREPIVPVYQHPDLVAKFEQQLDEAISSLMSAAGSTPPIPQPGTVIDLDAIAKALHDTAVYLANLAAATAEAVAEILAAAAGLVLEAGATEVTDIIKCALYRLHLALYALYRQVTQVLVVEGYATPYTDDLDLVIQGKGGVSFSAANLWQSPGNLPAGAYPVEEMVESIAGAMPFSLWAPQRQGCPVAYHPYWIPSQRPAHTVEQPSIPNGAAPYAAGSVPDAFIGTGMLAAVLPAGLDDMFAASGPSMSQTRNFGTALDNCRRAISALLGETHPQGFTLPNYNLDGDRGYAWPCWDLELPPQPDTPSTMPSQPAGPDWARYVSRVPEPISPTDYRNHGTVHIDASSVTD